MIKVFSLQHGKPVLLDLNFSISLQDQPHAVAVLHLERHCLHSRFSVDAVGVDVGIVVVDVTDVDASWSVVLGDEEEDRHGRQQPQNLQKNSVILSFKTKQTVAETDS